MTRLVTHIWVGAYLTRLRLMDIPVFVTSKGDRDAGTVLVKLNTLDGKAQLFHRRFDLFTGDRLWDVLASNHDMVIDENIQKQRQSDPDLWVIEVEDPKGRHMLDDPGLQA
ncbi:MAG: DUF1491 family protein [Pseudomonadota bacterium]